MKSSALLLASLTLSGGLFGCASGANPCIAYTIFAVSPTAGAADHMAKAPGNQQQFLATVAPGATGSHCVVPANVRLVQATWTVSDAINVQISSATDATNGLATCLGATTGPVQVLASFASGNGTGAPTLTAVTTLVCK